MTIEEMKERSNDAAEYILDASELTGQSNKITSVLWWCCAEICERLDKIIEQQINKPVFITKYDPPKIGSSD